MAIERTALPEHAGLRVEYALPDLYDELPSRSRARKLLRAGAFSVEGRVVGTGWLLKAGDRIAFDAPPPHDGRVLERDLDVVYEDDFMAVVSKTADMHTSGSRAKTINRALPFNLQPSTQPDALSWPRAVHRLDARTEGLLVVAKTGGAEVALGRAFEARRVHKSYRALCVGRLEGAGVVEAPVGGRAARSRYAAMQHSPSRKLGWLSLIALEPETGRTHQLRQHLAFLGHPIIGDDLYAGDRPNLHGHGLMLQACGLRLDHPVTGQPLELQLPEPRKFARLRDWERRGYMDQQGLPRRAGPQSEAT